MGDDAPSSSPSLSSSSRSPSTPRTKRRRTERYVLGFEFAPRLAPYELPSSPETERVPSPEAPPPRAAAEWTEGSSFALLDAWGGRSGRSCRRGIRTSFPETGRVPSPVAPPPRAAPDWAEGSSSAAPGDRSGRRGISASSPETQRISSPEALPPRAAPDCTEGSSFALLDARGHRFVRSGRRSETKRILSRAVPEWTEGSTFALLDAWGGFVRSGRRSIRAKEWLEVARLTSVAAGRPAGYYSEFQCRNRIDTLLKKLKREKERMRMAARRSLPTTSRWVYFDKLMSITYPPPSRPSTTTYSSDRQSSPSPLPLLLPNVVTRQRDTIPSRLTRLPWGADAPERMLGEGGDTGPRDSRMDAESGEEQKFEAAWQNQNGFAVSTKPIQKFGDVIERLENHRRQQMVEVDQMRKDFFGDLDAKWREILEKAQAEIAYLEDMDSNGSEVDEEDGDDGDGNESLGYVSGQGQNNGKMDASGPSSSNED